MADKKTFRTALNGFNREDVVHYIEYLNAQHAAQVEQLTAELAFLRNKAEQEQAAASAETTSALTQTNAALEAQLQAALAEKGRLEEDVQAALAAKYQAETALETLQNQQVAAQKVACEELEAYRRAERTERLARERAEQVYHQVNGVLGDATVKVDEAAGSISVLSDQVLTQLNQLQEAVSGSKQALQEAADTMYALRPTQEEP